MAEETGKLEEAVQRITTRDSISQRKILSGKLVHLFGNVDLKEIIPKA